MNRIRVTLSHEFELTPQVDDASGFVVLSEKDHEDAFTYILGALTAYCGRGKVQRFAGKGPPVTEDAIEKQVAIHIPRQSERFPDAFLKAIGILLRELTHVARSGKGPFGLEVEILEESPPQEGQKADRLILVGRLIKKQVQPPKD